MSTPFPLEEQALEQQPATWNPWNGPTHPGFFAGLEAGDEATPDSAFIMPGQRTLQGISTRLLEGIQTGASHLELALGQSELHGADQAPPGATSTDSRASQLPSAVARQLSTQGAEDQIQDARERIKATTPDPSTTGAAVQIIHGLGAVGTEFTAGSLAGGPIAGAAVVGGSEYTARKDELMQQGVDEATATKSGLVAGVANAAGVIVPFGLGAGLLTKVGTGALTNTGFGIANRYADHKILEDAGYKDMADQVKVMDGSQLLTDAIMGGFFGGQSYLHEHVSALKNAHNTPGFEDAAMTSNLANADRRSSPGVPTTPEAANVHQSALETAIEQLSSGNPVNVSEPYSKVLYHVSPHDFDQFDLSKIGTGEGNDTYARGIYTAENPEVRDEYVKMFMESHDKANVYEVRTPDALLSKSLDLDKPLSEQPHVMEALGVDPNNPSPLPNRVTPDMTGQELYSALSKGRTNLGVEPTRQAAAEFLDSKGISVATYKDQGSRGYGTGKGTRNAIFFNPKRDAEIISKNGVPVERPPEFLQRPAPETKAASQLLQEHLKQGGILDEEANLRDLEALLAQKRTLPERPSKAATKPTVPPKSGTTVSAAEQKAYVEHAKAGYEVKMNPASSDGKGNLVSKDGKTPVFEVTGKIAQDTVKQALTEKPNMTIPSASGEVKAADAIKAVDEAVAKGQKEIPAAIKAATDCFGRKGG